VGLLLFAFEGSEGRTAQDGLPLPRSAQQCPCPEVTPHSYSSAAIAL